MKWAAPPAQWSWILHWRFRWIHANGGN